jgi:hypothetical protein
VSKTRKRGVSAIKGGAAVGTIVLVGGIVGVATPAFAAAPTATLAVTGTPTAVLPGGTAQAAASETVTVTNNFTANDSVAIDVSLPDQATATTLGQSVEFNSAALPTITVAAAAGNTGSGEVAPQILDETVTANPADDVTLRNAGVTDQLNFVIGNTATGATTTDQWVITISGISYNVGANAGSNTGPVPVSTSGTYSQYVAPPAVPVAVAMTNSPQTNADVVNVKATTTPVGIPIGSDAAPVSNETLTELTGDTVQPGLVTLAPAHGAIAGPVTVTATNATVALPTGTTTPPSCTATAGTASVTQNPNANGDIYFCVVAASSLTGSPATYAVSGITYNDTGVPVGAQPFTFTFTAVGGGTVTAANPQPAVTVVSTLPGGRIGGVSADATAALVAENAFGNTAINNGHGAAAIVASNAEFQDALSASFLGKVGLPYQALNSSSSPVGYQHPILLVPPTPPTTGMANTAAANAIRTLGITTVYVVGGPDAVSSAVDAQMRQIQVGTGQNGGPVYLQVIRIYGQTAGETAQAVAEYPTLTGHESYIANTPAAYGMYNSTFSESANAGSTSTLLKTAILVDESEFQDAASGSTLAYANSTPILLTGTGSLSQSASSAITNLGIQQVIVLGGNLAVSDNVVSSVEAMGVPVLRIAGQTAQATSAEFASYLINDFAKGSTTSPAQRDGLNALDATYDPVTNTTSANSLGVGTARGDFYTDALVSSQQLGAAANPIPLLLTVDTATLGPDTTAFLNSNGTSPMGGAAIYSNNVGASIVVPITGDYVFGGLLAQTPALVTSEFNAIAAG